MAAVPLAWALSILVRARGRLLDQLAVFSRTSGFSLLLAGFLVGGRVLADPRQKLLWMAVLDVDVYRPVKTARRRVLRACLGYLLMLFAQPRRPSTTSGSDVDRAEAGS